MGGDGVLFDLLVIGRFENLLMLRSVHSICFQFSKVDVGVCPSETGLSAAMWDGGETLKRAFVVFLARLSRNSLLSSASVHPLKEH
jgi:hypothetical protein